MNMKEPNIKTINELKIFVGGKFEHLDEKFSTKLEEIDQHLKELKNSFDGNGKDGTKTRVSHWERFRTFLTRGGIIVLTGWVAHYLGLLQKLMDAIHIG